jgi:predicted transcriptional regulator
MTACVTIKPLVFSLRGIYLEMFFDDRKGFEFRTRRPRVEAGDTVLLYQTAPTKMITATAIVGIIYNGSPAKIWELTGSRGGITKQDFDKYFYNRGRAVAIELEVTKLAEPLALPFGMSPPQSWARWQGPWPLGNVSTGDRVAPA